MLLPGTAGAGAWASNDKKKRHRMPLFRRRSNSKSILWSFDLLVLGFSTPVVGRSLAVVGFLDFVTWLCHGYSKKKLLNLEKRAAERARLVLKACPFFG
jgi:uncharacterized iron-regulated membrane protein